jgi:hypothetical protein
MAQQRLELVLDDVVDGQPVWPSSMPVVSESSTEPARCQQYFDPVAFSAMVDKGRAAWADVADASQWVEELRGNG